MSLELTCEKGAGTAPGNSCNAAEEMRLDGAKSNNSIINIVTALYIRTEQIYLKPAAIVSSRERRILSMKAGKDRELSSKLVTGKATK